MDSNLPFTGRQFPRIYVCGLEGSEPGLDRACLVAVRPSEEEWNVQHLQDVQEHWCRVVSGIVHHDYVGLSPARPLRVKLNHQLPEE